MTAQEWARMSWHARQRWRAARTTRSPEEVDFAIPPPEEPSFTSYRAVVAARRQVLATDYRPRRVVAYDVPAGWRPEPDTAENIARRRAVLSTEYQLGGVA